MAAAVGLIDVRAWLTPWELAALTAFGVTAAVIAMWGIAALVTPTLAAELRTLVVVVACLYTLAMTIQVLLGEPPTGWAMKSPRYAGALIAIAVPLAGWSIMPVLGLGLLLSQSYLAVLAAMLGLLVQGRARWGRLSLVGALILLLSMVGALRWLGHQPVSPIWQTRVETYQLAARDFRTTPWLGFGGGGWRTRMPLQQLTDGQIDLFEGSHSEVVGWLYENGLIGMVLVGTWLLLHARGFLRSSVRGAVVAVAILATGLHIFHVAALSPWIVVVMALGYGEAGHA